MIELREGGPRCVWAWSPFSYALGSSVMPSYRDLLAWQLARENALAIYRYADRCWMPQRAAPLDQLRRAALSIQLNIAEGQASGPGPRCRFHLRVAHASAVETHDLLTFLQDLGADLDPMVVRSVRVQQLTYRLWKAS
ncbi:MAG: four helix bundle protein [Gemmatimonadales bacterium]|nr:four helix bundle protein [Gemmatimonadales bacterium]MBP9897430.1 four helix bundle protein [Gemmatimonadales bacterium]